ncbi:MAG: efflux transporter outer membrane subunit, partial [Brachymonas sp.]|nr:efflux transporter outer membrane subunit [Brachymonas sp.]
MSAQKADPVPHTNTAHPHPNPLPQAGEGAPTPAFKAAFGLFALAAVLSGCAAVGPDFEAPKAQAPEAWNTRPSSAPELTARLPIQPQTAPEPWWTLFNDATLNQLQQRLITNSPDLQTAFLRFSQSRAQQSMVAAQAGPQVALQGRTSRQRQSENAPETRMAAAMGGPNSAALTQMLSTPFDQYQVGFDMAWEIDLWGRVRRSLESSQASSDAAGALLQHTHLTLSSELARAYFQLRLLQQQRALLAQQTTLAADTTALLQQQVQKGLMADMQAIPARNQWAALQAHAAPLQAQEAALANQISLLLGAQPGELSALLTAPENNQAAQNATLPDLRLGLPADLVRRRPDIRAAEAKLHAATADIGVAVADLYPRISLGLSAGFNAMTASKFGDWGSRTWQIGPVLSLPIFDMGRRRATVELRKLQQQEAAVAWQKTVLTAWQEVDDALINYAAEQQRN